MSRINNYFSILTSGEIDTFKEINMKTELIEIDNRKAILIPEVLLEGKKVSVVYDITNSTNGFAITELVDMEMKPPREGWSEQLIAAGAREDDMSEFEDLRNTQNEFDKEEWTW
jgi:hypothetical protein